MSAQSRVEARDLLRNKLRIRSGGKCECTSSCEHHKPGQCGVVLVPGLWFACDILPAEANASQKVSMLEAVCEACRLNPRIENQASQDAKRGNPNWWYQRRSGSRNRVSWLAA
jgi:hypothetical protein